MYDNVVCKLAQEASIPAVGNKEVTGVCHANPGGGGHVYQTFGGAVQWRECVYCGKTPG